jgi:hypothetical protein
MKKIFILLMGLSVIASAQEFESDCINTSKSSIPIIENDKSATVIWSEDFSNGFPNSWTQTTANTSGGLATCNWVWSNDGSWGNFSGGGATTADSAINSTTSNNGFLISDIDSANHFVNGQPSGSNYEYIDSYFTTEAISTLGHSSVALEFEHNFRFNNSIDLVISVSNDSVSWIDFFVQGSSVNNQESADPELLNLNISCVAGNQATVYVKVGWSARVYYWMIDDMRLIETPNHNLELQESNYGGWFTTPTANGFGLDYSFYPLNQAVSHPYNIEGVVRNIGGQSQMTRLNVEVKDANGISVFNGVSNDSLLSPQNIACDFDVRVFLENSGFTPSAIGSYQFDIWAESDSAITNTISMVSMVTDDVYGRDDGIQHSDYGVGRSCGGMIIGNYFDLYVADELKSISVFIDDKSVAGAEVYVAIYEVDLNNDKVLIEQSSDYDLQPNDIGSWVEIHFDNSILLNTGTYMAAIGGYTHPFDTSVVAMSVIGRESTSYIQKNGCLNSGQANASWYWLSRVPMIRMNMGISSAIQESYFDGSIEVFPNPSKWKITLEMNKVSSDKYSVKIVNLIGQTVFSHEKEITDFYKEDIDISAFGKGTYFITISNSTTTYTEKLIIE